MLRPYSHSDFELLNSWITDAELLLQFSGPDWQFPLTADVLNDHIQKHPDRYLYIGCTEDGEPFAFGQIITNEANAPRLGRLLVDANMRGKGMGTQFVKELLIECQRITASPEIYLFVDELNLQAIRCYEKNGFIRDTGFHEMKTTKGIVIIKRMTFKTTQ
ncbi:MAG: GNAT family protein [Bacteroidota bacterium]